MQELSLNIMDVAQNSIVAGATLITIHAACHGDRLTVEISDNGKGMSEEQLAHVTDPFFTTRTTRKVGLGVPLFKMQAELTGGMFSIDSQTGIGTHLKAEFVTSHVDMIPLGDLNQTILLLITCNPDLDFVFIHDTDETTFTLDTRELREVLGGEVPLNDPAVTKWIREALEEG